MILVDMSEFYGVQDEGDEKRVVAARLAAMMAFRPSKMEIRLVSLHSRILWNATCHRKTENVLRIIDEILRFDPVGSGTDLAQALEFIGRVNRRKSSSF